MKARSLFAGRAALVDQATATAPVHMTGMRDALRVANLTTGGRSETFDS